MSVQLNQVTKIFGQQKAVDQISFTANHSEILGFLGPNGAGKTTTMKIISGFYQASSGTVEVCGINVEENPSEAKKNIGYLPENNPLYKDMYVREYLRFFAKLNNIPNAHNRVEEMIQLTGLTKEHNKIIGTLSKGYRQRVGLSQAMLHNPKVLVLDEPTTGLDPNQIVEIRELIRGLAKEKTIILSTHIMQEVKLLCDRVIIINNGKLIADDSIHALQNQMKDRQVVHVEFKNEISLDLLKKIPEVESVKSLGQGKYSFYSTTKNDLRDIISEYCSKNNYPIREMIKDKNSVEEVFSLLTNKNQA
ncbi:MAG: gliding motility-associated ABC transporter ATP-binding subunit GldA [Saprospiraceae bacterium]